MEKVVFLKSPGPAWLKSDLEPASAIAKNQPQVRDFFYWSVDWEVYGCIYGTNACSKAQKII